MRTRLNKRRCRVSECTYESVLEELDELVADHVRVGVGLPEVGHVVDLGEDLVHHLVHVVDSVLVGYEGTRYAGDGARHRDEREHVLHVQHVLVPQREHDEHGEDRAEREHEELGHHGQELAHEALQVLQRRLVGARETRVQLVVQLVEVAEIEPAVVGPLARAQHARVALDQLQRERERGRQNE